MFKILYARSVQKDIKKIDKKWRKKIKEEIEKLKDFPDISNVNRLTAHPLADYRLRIGDYRVLFDVEWNKKIIYILKIGRRKEVY